MAKEKIEKESEKNKTEEKDVAGIVLAVLVGIFILVFVVNTFRFYGLTAQVISATTGGLTGQAISSVSTSEVIPKGVPAIYGAELQVKYDDISAANQKLADATIYKLAIYDQKITLSGEKLQRYIAIGSSISCEYCCGAEAIIFSDGSAACGCAHSYAMRGLAKYLLQNHPEMSDIQILEELGKWKVLFFPDIHAQKAAILKQNGIELNYINLASNKYRGIEQGAAGGGMVGGC